MLQVGPLDDKLVQSREFHFALRHGTPIELGNQQIASSPVSCHAPIGGISLTGICNPFALTVIMSSIVCVSLTPGRPIGAFAVFSHSLSAPNRRTWVSTLLVTCDVAVLSSCSADSGASSAPASPANRVSCRVALFHWGFCQINEELDPKRRSDNGDGSGS